jgi:hypothetical protein
VDQRDSPHLPTPNAGRDRTDQRGTRTVTPPGIGWLAF